MGFIPSIKLSEALAKAGVGIWIEQLGDGRIALVCKGPETVIKALRRGVTCTLLLSTIRAESFLILCLGLWIDDERQNPFKASMINCSPEDAELLTKVLESGTTTLHCMNELNHPVLSAWCTLERQAAAAAAVAFRGSDHWLLTLESSKLVQIDDLGRIFDLALDRFQDHIHRPLEAAVGDHVKMTANIPLKLDIWKPQEVFEVTPTATGGPFLIDDTDEGPKLERQVHVVVDCIYPGNAHICPAVQDGKKLRELTDVLGFDQDFICVIQAKAIAVFSANDEQPSSRRKGNVEKDIQKAMKQLAGALTNIRNGSAIFTHEERALITIPNRESSPAHAIVVLSEMYTFIDWKAVAADVAKASDSEHHRALFHVMDIQELAKLASNCPDAQTFSNRLLQRWCFVKERGHAYIRTQFPIRFDTVPPKPEDDIAL
jgi:hypothetical protein